MSTLGVFVVLLGHKWVGYVYIAYFLGGVGVGTYESNMLSCVTPLGHSTKTWVILGMPMGFTLISVGGFLLMGAGLPPVALYLAVAVACVAGALVMAFRVPDVELPNNSKNLGEFVENARRFRLWAPFLPWHCAALMIDMFSVSAFTSMTYFVLNGTKVSLWGVSSDAWLVDKDWFFAVVNVFVLLGDSVSRKAVYAMPRLYHPWLWLLCNVAGGLCVLSAVPILYPFGMFAIYWGNGAVYGTTTKHIDSTLSRRFNLIALSFWLFIGDVGSVTGGQTWPALVPHFCAWLVPGNTQAPYHVANPYFCLPDATKAAKRLL
jgi:hypothetical protein